jgi:hypothetical protein
MITPQVVPSAVQRAELVAALTGVTAPFDGNPVTITAHPSPPVAISPYDAWPVLIDARPITLCLAEIDWLVIVALPAADARSTTDAGDALIGAVTAALMDAGDAKVTHIRPARWISEDGGNGIPVWQFEITK